MPPEARSGVQLHKSQRITIVSTAAQDSTRQYNTVCEHFHMFVFSAPPCQQAQQAWCISALQLQLAAQISRVMCGVEWVGTCWSVWQPGGELSPGLVSALCTAPAPAAPALVPAVTSESILQAENMNKQSIQHPSVGTTVAGDCY